MDDVAQPDRLLQGSSDLPADSESHDRLQPIAPGLLLGSRYRLQELLVERGPTSTWKVWDDTLSRVALAHVLPVAGERTEAVLRAARDAATATDSRFLRVLDAVEAGPGQAASYVICEYAEGASLQEILHLGPLSGLSVAWLVRELADALAPMHAKGLFHGRLSPDTVIITSSGNIKIVGFLIDAALYPLPGDEELTWSEREAIDVRSLGKLLYAGLVAHWPVTADHTGQQVWGLPAAPRNGLGLVPPAKLHQGVSPVLDAITMQAVEPRADSVPLRTINEVATALSRVLGNAEATDELEHRVQAVVTHSGARAAASSVPDLDDHDAGSTPPTRPDRTLEFPAVVTTSPTDETGSIGSPAPYEPDQDATTALQRVAPATPTAFSNPRPVPASSQQAAGPGHRVAQPKKGTPSRAQGQAPGNLRSRRLLVALVALALVITLFFSLKSCGGATGLGGRTPEQVPITAARVFDPPADQGDGKENDAEIPLAFDGNAETIWRTSTYLNKPTMAGLKQGVGVVFDLGKEIDVREVRLVLEGSPTAVQIRVPATGADGDNPPMNRADEWVTVAENAAAEPATTLTLNEPAATRWVLVYFTSLPNIGGNKYRAGLAEIVVLS